MSINMTPSTLQLKEELEWKAIEIREMSIAATKHGLTLGHVEMRKPRVDKPFRMNLYYDNGSVVCQSIDLEAYLPEFMRFETVEETKRKVRMAAHIYNFKRVTFFLHERTKSLLSNENTIQNAEDSAENEEGDSGDVEHQYAHA